MEVKPRCPQTQVRSLAVGVGTLSVGPGEGAWWSTCDCFGSSHPYQGCCQTNTEPCVHFWALSHKSENSLQMSFSSWKQVSVQVFHKSKMVSYRLTHKKRLREKLSISNIYTVCMYMYLCVCKHRSLFLSSFLDKILIFRAVNKSAESYTAG